MNSISHQTSEKNRVATYSIFAALFLTGGKLLVGIHTGSLGILSEALHSGLDLVAAAITWYAVRIADKPADDDHHFGHGKVENLSAFFETILLLITSVWVVYEAVSRLISGETEIELSPWAFVVVGASIVIDFSRSRALMRVAKKYNSQALEADALHFRTDIWSSAVVLLGIGAAQFGFFIADSIAAIGVALIILVASYQLGRRSINVLLDKVPKDTFLNIKKILSDCPEILYYHNLKVRASGSDIFIELNIHLPKETDFLQSHELSNKIERRISSEIPRSFVHVHVEPDIDHD